MAHETKTITMEEVLTKEASAAEETKHYDAVEKSLREKDAQREKQEKEALRVRQSCMKCGRGCRYSEGIALVRFMGGWAFRLCENCRLEAERLAEVGVLARRYRITQAKLAYAIQNGPVEDVQRLAEDMECWTEDGQMVIEAWLMPDESEKVALAEKAT